MRISDWSSDVCSSDLNPLHILDRQSARTELVGGQAIDQRHVTDRAANIGDNGKRKSEPAFRIAAPGIVTPVGDRRHELGEQISMSAVQFDAIIAGLDRQRRSEEHTSELQSLMRISYAVFCLKKKKTNEE